MSKRGGARLFVAAGQPQGGGCVWKFKGGRMLPPPPPKYTPDGFVVEIFTDNIRCPKICYWDIVPLRKVFSVETFSRTDI